MLYPTSILKTVVLSAVLSLAVTASKSFKVNRTVSTDGLQKRFDNERFTWYDITSGDEPACGHPYSNSDFVVALDGNQYGDGENCFKKISISANGKTATATVADDCPDCSYGGLDLTEGLFEYFAPLDTGVLTGSWNFV